MTGYSTRKGHTEKTHGKDTQMRSTHEHTQGNVMPSYHNNSGIREHCRPIAGLHSVT